MRNRYQFKYHLNLTKLRSTRSVPLVSRHFQSLSPPAIFCCTFTSRPYWFGIKKIVCPFHACTNYGGCCATVSGPHLFRFLNRCNRCAFAQPSHFCRTRSWVLLCKCARETPHSIAQQFGFHADCALFSEVIFFVPTRRCQFESSQTSGLGMGM